MSELQIQSGDGFSHSGSSPGAIHDSFVCSGSSPQRSEVGVPSVSESPQSISSQSQQVHFENYTTRIAMPPREIAKVR